MVAASAIYGLTVGNSILLLPVIAQAEFPSERGKVVASVSSSNQLALSRPRSLSPWCSRPHTAIGSLSSCWRWLQAVGLSVMVWIWTTRSDRTVLPGDLKSS